MKNVDSCSKNPYQRVYSPSRLAIELLKLTRDNIINNLQRMLKISYSEAKEVVDEFWEKAKEEI